jgi:hypothetical protein
VDDEIETGLCCQFIEWENCECDDAYPGWEDCETCGGKGRYLPEHCCACGGSPYCQCCRTCGASCVAACTCPISVTLESGKTLTV